MKKRVVLEYVREVLAEKKVREADHTDGSKVPFGSNKHVKDLEARIASAISWRDRQKKGTEARANYSRLVTRLKQELSAASRKKR